jgi:hypothetical protein
MRTPKFSKQKSKQPNVIAPRDVRSMVEHPAFNRRDEGSSPSRPTDGRLVA